jgi:hypothetical protein
MSIKKKIVTYQKTKLTKTELQEVKKKIEESIISTKEIKKFPMADRKFLYKFKNDLIIFHRLVKGKL